MNDGKTERDISALLILLWCTELYSDKGDRKKEESVSKREQ